MILYQENNKSFRNSVCSWYKGKSPVFPVFCLILAILAFGGVFFVFSRKSVILFFGMQPEKEPDIQDYVGGRKINLPVVAISTDPKNLWDPRFGIYTKGLNRNFAQKGMDWERPVKIHFFEPNGELGFEMDLGLRIHGGATRGNAQKSLRLIPRDKYGQNIINYPIFPDLPYTKYRRFLLRTSGNDWWSTLMRDTLMQSLVSDLKLDVQASRPAVVFLNGEYWGIHNIQEYQDLRYFKNHYGVKDDTITVLEPIRENGGYPEIREGFPGDEKSYLDMLYFVSKNDLSIPENYAHLQTLMDVENFIDYYNVQIFFADDDWLHHNVKVWRFRTEKYDPSARYGLDGRWRWLLYDTDVGFDKINVNLLEFATAPDVKGFPFATFLLRNLLKNEDFKRDFINRHADLLNSTFLPNVMLLKINQMHDEIAPEIPFHIQKWGGKLDKGAKPAFSSVEKWEENVEHLRKFALLRPAVSRKHFVEKFGLGGETALKVKIEGKGKVWINKLEYQGFPKELIYFQNVPVPILAEPEFRYKFAGWETNAVLSQESDQRRNLILFNSETADLTAKFVPVIKL